MPLNKERGSRMKRLVCILLAAMTALSFAACQKTPDEVVVVKKDTERLVEQVRENSGENNHESTAGNALAEKLGTPDRFLAKNVYSDNFIMTADAKIVLPDAEVLPTVRVIPADFSQETVDKLYNYLVEDTVMYEMQSRRTKTDIETELVGWKQTLNDPNTTSEQKKQAEEKITELTGQYATAPETIEYKKGSPTIRELESRDFFSGELQYTYMGVNLTEEPGHMDTSGKYFEVHQNNTGDEIIKTENVGGFSVVDTASRGARFYYTNTALLESALGRKDGRSFEVGKITQEEWENAGYEFTGICPDEARAAVNDLLSAIGINNMTVSSVEMCIHTSYDAGYSLSGNSYEAYKAAEQEFLSGKHNDKITGATYRVYCVRQVNGVNVTSDTFSSYLDDSYGKQWYYETFTADICKDGIYCVSWVSPHEITETIAEDTKLLSFKDVEETINQMFRASHDPGPDSSALFEYDVEQVVLSLRRIADPGGVESGLLVPVWDIYGKSWVTYPGEPKMPGNNDISLLTINAIDGTIIDLSKGY